MRIDWDKIKAGCPKAASEMIDEMRKAYDAEPQDGIRAIDKALREKTASLCRQFDALKKDVAK